MSSADNAELQDALKKLDSVRAEYADFLYSVSHDLNAPLRHISSFTNLIVKKHGNDFDEQTLTHFDYITAAGDELCEMLDGLLTLSRLNTQQNPFEIVNLDTALDDVCNAYLPGAISESGAEIEYQNLPEISADPDQIRLLLKHIISNAIKFVPKEVSPKVSITHEDAGEYWHIRASDNGIGIDEKNYENAFKLFWTGNKPGDYPGHGAGLAIAKKILEIHQGDINFSAAPEKGTTINIRLPK